MTRTTDEWEGLLDEVPAVAWGNSWTVPHEALAEVVRLRRDVETYIADLRAGLIYAYGKDGKLTQNQVESLAYDLTRILEGGHQ